MDDHKEQFDSLLELRSEERKVQDFEPQLYNRVSDNLYYQGLNEFGSNAN